jgi:ribosomal protein L12E/L44/L45/RPP1/RPP2
VSCVHMCAATLPQASERAAALLSIHSRALLRVFHWYALLAPGKGRVTPDALCHAAPQLLPHARLLGVLKDSRYSVRPERVREALATVLSLEACEPQSGTAAAAAAAAAAATLAEASAPATPRTPREKDERRLTFPEFAETLLAVAAATHAATRDSQGALQQLERLVNCMLVDARCITMPLHVRVLSPGSP